jgi:hypothetical protein
MGNIIACAKSLVPTGTMFCDVTSRESHGIANGAK